MSVAARVEPDDAVAGFTLLEVLVALAVLALSLTSIGALVAANMRSTLALDRHLALISTARAIETGLPGASQAHDNPLTGTMNGHAWRVDYRSFSGGAIARRPASPWVPRTVVITVAAPDGAKFRLETVRLRRRSAP